MHTAVGVNCGPGTFLVGAQKHFKVLMNLVESNIGSETCTEINHIPAVKVSTDYSEWPDVTADVVLANAESLEEAMNACKFVYSRNYRLGVLDIRSTQWLSRESIYNSLAEMGFQHGYRVCYLFYSCLSFDTGFAENRLSYVMYKKDRTFNISAPTLAETLRTLYDHIKDVLHAKIEEVAPSAVEYNVNCCYPLTYDEKLCAKKLKEGESLVGQALLREHNLPGSSRAFLNMIRGNQEYRDIKRSGWGLKLPSSDSLRHRYLHPTANRFLSIGEMQAICEWQYCPIGPYPIEQMMYGTPIPAANWICLQLVHYLADKWGNKDYALNYSAKEKRFKGGDANPLRPKKYIDLSEYKNVVYVRNEPKIFPHKPRFDSDFVEY